jgi:hypothetical protein
MRDDDECITSHFEMRCFFIAFVQVRCGYLVYSSSSQVPGLRFGCVTSIVHVGIERAPNVIQSKNSNKHQTQQEGGEKHSFY